MTSTIKACMDQLETDLRAALVPDFCDEIYDYRTLRDEKDRALSISHLSTEPGDPTLGGKGRRYEFALYMTYRHTGTHASLRIAERGINDLENQIFDTLEGSTNTLWKLLEFHRASTKPGAPDDPGLRYGAVYFRLLLK